MTEPCEKPTSARALSSRPALGERLVDKGVEDRRRRAHAGQLRPGAAILRAVPLVAVGRHVAREGRVRRQELGLGQQRRPIGGEPDQIVAVGAEPVQQDHQMRVGLPPEAGGWDGPESLGIIGAIFRRVGQQAGAIAQA